MKNSNKNRKRIFGIILVMCLSLALVGCSSSDVSINVDEEIESDGDSTLIVVGFSQPGAESAWRVTPTESVKNAFTEERGYKIIYKDAKSKQDNQIKDIREFILQGVDYIVLSPIVETGWDQVFEEAKLAGIPIIVCDRAVTVSNESLYTAFVGSNFRREGSIAVACIENLLKERAREEDKNVIATDDSSEDTIHEYDKNDESTGEKNTGDEDIEDMDGEDVFNIVHIQGTLDSSAQVGRSKSLEEAVLGHSNWKIIAQSCGDFTKGKAREAMKNILDEIDGSSIDMVYCENDEEAFGVMEALSEAGLEYGRNGIIIVSFDGQATALEMCRNGMINVEVECNPLQGEYIYNIICKLENGEDVPKIAYIDEEYFTPDDLTEEFIKARVY